MDENQFEYFGSILVFAESQNVSFSHFTLRKDKKEFLQGYSVRGILHSA